ncbi:MAG: hypothetical protein GX621_17270, partial [Pirellulaceae bacterium]|nr:hypothetical protein [Pirellulaceae bacterium]
MAAHSERMIEGLVADRFVLSVLGKAKRGKSTLLNALLGRTDDLVAPVDKLPASSAVSRFRWAPQEGAAVVYRTGMRQSIGFHQIKEFVTEECNPENSKGVDVVEIEGPFPGLERDLDLIDTPGAASIHEHHDAILHAFIPQSDAVIFLVTGRMPLDQDELDLLSKVKEADISKIFFVINRIDEASEADLLDAERHNKEILARAGVHVDQMHRISAKRAFSGDRAASGVPELMAAIAQLMADHKGHILNTRFVHRVRETVAPIVRQVELDAASRAKSTTELEQDLASLREKKHKIESERELAERQFRLAWRTAFEAFERGLADAKNRVDGEVSKRFDATAALGVSKLAKELPTWLNDRID